MLDDMEESRSAHSIGIVENPLYAEDEAGPTFSGLAAKEKEAEVCTTCSTTHTNEVGGFVLSTHIQAEMEIAPEKGQAFSVNFGPPNAEEDF